MLWIKKLRYLWIKKNESEKIETKAKMTKNISGKKKTWYNEPRKL